MDPLSRFSSQIAFRSCPPPKGVAFRSSEPKKDCSVEHGKVELLTFPHRSKSCPFAAGRKQQSMPLFPANTKAFPVSAMTGTSKKVSLSRKYKYDFHEKIFPLATQLSHAQKAFWGQTTCPVESAAFDQAGCPPGQKAKLSTRLIARPAESEAFDHGGEGKSASNQFPGKIIAILLAALGNPGLRLGQFLKLADKVGRFLFFHK